MGKEEKKKNRTPQPNNDQPKENQGSQALGQYSKNLGEVATQLKNAAESFKTTASDIKKSNDSLISTLKNIAEAFGKEVKDDTDQSKKDNKQNVEDMSKVWDRASRNQEEHLSKAQIIGGILIDSFKAVFNFALKHFIESFNKVLDDYNANLETITSRMQWSNGQYSDMLYRTTDRIFRDKLQFEFSQIDLNKSLIPVLETGIRGGLAEDMAYRNMITNRVLPMINTNTRQYTRMSKVFGEKFTQGVQAIGTYTQRYLESAEGLEEGGYDTAIQTIYRELQDQVRQEGGTADEVSERMTQILGAYSNAAATFGKDYAEKAIEDYSAFLRGDAVMQSNLESLLPGINARDASFEQYLEAQQNLITEYMSDPDMKSAYAAQAFGFDVTVIQDVLNGMYFQDKASLKSTEQMMKGFNVNSENQKTMNNLTQGYYQSVTDRMDNFNENVVAKAATFIGEHIPYAEEVLSGIWGLLSKWIPLIFNAILNNSFSNLLGGNGSGGLLSKFVDGYKGSTFINGGSFTMFGKQIGGSKLAGIDAGLKNLWGTAGGSGIGGASTGLGSAINLAAGPGALIAGGIWAAADAIKGGKSTWQDTHDVGKTIGSGALAALTGRGLMTKEKEQSNLQAALSGEHVKFDWGSMWANAGKGALIGMGAGTAAGGWAAGLGTVIGTAVGGLAGAVSNAIQQHIEAKKFNQFADALKESTSALETFKQSADNYSNALDRQKQFNQAFAMLSKNLAEGKKALQELFPQYTSKIEDITSADDEYVQLLKKKIEYETLITEKQFSESGLDAANAVYNTVEKAEALVGDKSGLLKKYASEFAGRVHNEDLYDDSERFRSVLKEEYYKFLEEAGLTENDYSYYEFASGLNDVAPHGKLIWDAGLASGHAGRLDEDTENAWGSSSALGAITWDNNYTQTTGDSGFQQEIDDYELGISTAYDEVVNTLQDQWSQMMDSLYPLADKIYDEKGELRSPEEVAATYQGGESNSSYRNIKEALSRMSSTVASIKKYSHMLSGATYTNYELNIKPYMEEYKDYWEAFGLPIPQFKRGIADIPYKSLIGILHNHEAVIPEEPAGELRNLSDSGAIDRISDFIHSLSQQSDLLKNVDFTSLSSLDGYHRDSVVNLYQLPDSDVILGISSDVAKLVALIKEKNNLDTKTYSNQSPNNIRVSLPNDFYDSLESVEIASDEITLTIPKRFYDSLNSFSSSNVELEVPDEFYNTIDSLDSVKFDDVVVDVPNEFYSAVESIKDIEITPSEEFGSITIALPDEFYGAVSSLTTSLGGVDTLVQMVEAQAVPTTATPLEDNTQLETITSAISIQTATLKGVLDSILGQVTMISTAVSGSQRSGLQESSIPDSVLKYKAVPTHNSYVHMV